MPAFKLAMRETRSTDLFIPFPHKTQTYNKSFFPHFTKLYNNLDPKIRNSADFSEFKCKLKEKFKPPKIKHYSRGISKRANSLHTQLRVGRSLLASHGFAIGLNPSDLCACKKPETTSHFLTSCPLYSRLRADLYDSISKVILTFKNMPKYKQVEIMLFGIHITKI